jgi:hypothetical protein
MATLKSIVAEIILEEKQKNLKVFYDIDINIKPKEKTKEDTGVIAPTPPAVPETSSVEPAAPVAESKKKGKGVLISEAGEILAATPELAPDIIPETPTAPKEDKSSKSEYTNKMKGELLVPQEDAMNIQTINDLVEYLSSKDHEEKANKTSVEKVLNKKEKKVKSGKVISEEVQDIILILTGVSGEASAIGDLIGKDDKIIIELMYGNNNTDNIGLKINKNSGTDVASTTIVKDGELLAGKFDPTLINKQILRTSNEMDF